MPETPARHSSVSDRPTTDPSGRLSSSLYNPSRGAPTLSPPTTSSSPHRSVSNPGLHPAARARRQAAGGFLLDNGSRTSSLDWPRERSEIAALYHQPSFGTDVTDGDTDPATMLDLVLSEAKKQKGELPLRKQRGNTLSVPGSSASGSRRDSGPGKGRTVSPTRSFLITGRRHIPSSPPPTPGRSSFSIPPLLFGGDPVQSKKRWSVGREQLRDLQREFKFSEATLQRTLKAKQSLELSALFKKLLEIEEERLARLATLQKLQGLPNEKIFEYNPLRAIRNRKLRNRKKIQLDVSPWEDPGVVEQWVEDVAVSSSSPAEMGPAGLPHPPPGEGRKLKRPKMDWIIEPEELLADYYWKRCEDYKRCASESVLKRRRQSAKSKESIGDKQRLSLDVDAGYRPSDDDGGRISTESPRKRRTMIGSRDYHQFLRGDDEGFESTATSSESENSEDDYLHGSSDTDDLDDIEPDLKGEDPKHHRRRRKFGRIIKGRHLHGKKKLKQHELELEERRRKQEAEEMEWIASENDEKYPIPLVKDQPEYRRSMDMDEEYELAPTGRGPLKMVGKMTTGAGLSMGFGGSKSSLERYPGVMGLGANGDFGDRADFVVPSIAISLSPPPLSEEPEIKDDDKKDSKMSPTKKLLGSIRKEGGAKEKDVIEESGRESLDIDRRYRKPNEKEKSSKISKVKSRVDKLRVEDLIPWKRGDPIVPSPTSSTFTVSDEEDKTRIFIREGTVSASEMEDHELRKQKTGSGPGKSKTSKHRSHYSTGQLITLHHDRIFRRSFDSEREGSPERRSSRLREPAIPLISRQRSPVRELKIDALRRKPENHLIFSRIKGLEPSQRQFTNAQEDPTKQPTCPPTPSSHANNKRDLHRARVSLLAAGILARGISASTPAVFNPQLRAINNTTHSTDRLLQSYTAKRTGFVNSTVPRYYGRISRINKSVSHTLTPMVRGVADEADMLSNRVTTELTLNVKKLQDEIFSLARRKKRGKMRWARRTLWATLEWVVVVLMWVVWSVFLVFRIVRRAGGLGIRVVRWVLWV